MGFTIRYIKKSELSKLVSFNRRNYRKGHILTEKKYLEWQFGSYPSSLDYYTVLGVFNDEKKLLGVLGLTFLDYLYFDKTVRCTSFANLMVDQPWRNIGLGYALLKEAEQINHLALDHGINRDAMRLFSGRGWIEKDMERYGVVLNVRAIERAINRRATGIKSAVRRTFSKKGFSFVPLARYDARLARLFKKTRVKYPITVDRSQAYIKWRYFMHPLIKYYVFAATRGRDIASFAVVRIDGDMTFRAGRIIDFISLDEAERFSLERIFDFCANENVNFVDYYFSGSAHLQSLKTLGFVDFSQKPYSFIPKSLNPVVRTGRTGINFVVTARERTVYKKALNIKNWYTTKGGGDQDRAY